MHGKLWDVRDKISPVAWGILANANTACDFLLVWNKIRSEVNRLTPQEITQIAIKESTGESRS